MADSGNNGSNTDKKVSREKCSSFLKVIDNSERFEHPEIPRIFPQPMLKIIFDNLTRSEYSNERPLFTQPIDPKFVVGTNADRRVIALMTLETAVPGQGFQRKTETISSKVEADLVITMVAMLSPHVSVIKDLHNLQRGTSFLSRIFLENFLTEQDLLRIMGEASTYFPTGPLQDRSRLGTWNIKSSSAELRIRLDHLSFAEFSVLMNYVALRIDERASKDLMPANLAP